MSTWVMDANAPRSKLDRALRNCRNVYLQGSIVNQESQDQIEVAIRHAVHIANEPAIGGDVWYSVHITGISNPGHIYVPGSPETIKVTVFQIPAPADGLTTTIPASAQP